MTKISVYPKWLDILFGKSGWLPASLAFGGSLGGLLIIYWSTYRDIVTIWWRADTYAHGFLIFPIVVYLVWLKRTDIARISPKPEPKAIFLMALFSLVWLLGYIAQVAVVEQFSVIAMLPIIAWVIFGTQIAGRLKFPLIYMFFMVPVGDFLVAPLQDVTANFTVWALQLTGIPVYLEGRFFFIPSGSFEVAAACSGVRYLIASVALGTLYAYLNFTSTKRRLIFIIAALLVPILANGVRAYGIVMTAHLSDYTLAVGVDHIIYGWLFFGIVMFLLFWVGSFFQEDAPCKSTIEAVGGDSESKNFSIYAVWALLAVGAAASGPAFASWIEAKSMAFPGEAMTLPEGVDGWDGPFDSFSQWKPTFVGAEELRAEYRKNNQIIQLYIAYYGNLNRGPELVSWNNSVFDADVYRRLGGGRDVVQLANGEKWRVAVTRLAGEGKSRLVWHWYEVSGLPTDSRVWAKIYLAKSRLLGIGRGSAAIAISSKYAVTPDEAEVVMKDFLDSMLPELHKTVFDR